MRRVRACVSIVALGLVAGLALAAVDPTDASAQERLRWKLAAGYPSTLPVIGRSQTRVTEEVERLTDGNFRIRFYEPGALVPGLGIFDAVAQGSVEMGFAGLGVWPGKDPAFSLFNAIPFGPTAPEYIAWMKYGGGEELMDEIVGQYGVKALNCNLLAPEASGWFRKEINSPEDLNGLKMRIAGLGGRTLEKFGVSSQVLAAPDIYPALERGVIDAAEFSMPVMDMDFGFHEVADHYYLPGWHQTNTFNHLLINKEMWDALPEEYRFIIQNVCDAEVLRSLAEGEAVNAEAIEKFKEMGVTIHRWPDEMLDRFREAWQEVAAEVSNESENFKRGYDSLQEFRERYRGWKELGYVE